MTSTNGGSAAGVQPGSRAGTTAGMPFGTGAPQSLLDDPGAERRQPGPPRDPRDDPAAAKAYGTFSRPVSVDLQTNYLGLTLRNPLVASPSPATSSIDRVKALADAGKAAELNANWAQPISLRGLIQEKLGAKDAAIADLKRAAALDPALQQPADALRRLGVVR